MTIYGYGDEAVEEDNEQNLEAAYWDRYRLQQKKEYEAKKAKYIANLIEYKEDILVCYEDGVIETDTYEWERMEGDLRHEQTLCGQVINLRDYKGYYVAPREDNSDEIPF